MNRAQSRLYARLAALACTASAFVAACDSSESTSSTTKPGSDASTTQDTAATGTDAVSTATDAVAAGTDAVAAGSDAVAAGTDAVSAGTDAVSAGTDAASTVVEQSGTFEVSTDISKDTIWKSGAQVTLSQHIHVTGAVLTIEPGVTILGKQGTSLVITTTGRLVSEGTKEKPIVFTSSKAVGSRAPGDWGGVVLLGTAPINVSGGSEKIEGFPSTATGLTVYGGTKADHDCGSLKYVRIEFAGFQLVKDNELNGLTMGGCGTGTKIDYVQVHKGNDDGIEVFGGTVDLKHVVITQPDDDGLDWDYGWVGRVQFAVIQQSKVTGDNGMECDSNKNNNDAEPRSKPTIWNLSIIGSDAEPGKAGKTQTVALFRTGTGVDIGNALFAHAADFAINVATKSSATQATSGNLKVHDSMFFDIANSNWPTSDTKGDDDEGFDEQAFFEKTEHKNVFGTDPMLTDATSMTAPNFTPKAGSPALTGGATPPAGGFFDTAATFRGAFGSVDWTAGWTSYPAN
jgi:hypothetical protein